MKFADLAASGRQLAARLAHLKDREPVVLALPRGVVAVGFEIAQALGAPLDIVLEEIERRRASYCEGRRPVDIAGRTAIVVDDGIATGATMRVALRVVWRRRPAHLVHAVAVAPPETLRAFRKEADETVCLETPVMLGAIGFHYRDFHQMSDAEVTDFLACAAEPTPEVGVTTVAEPL